MKINLFTWREVQKASYRTILNELSPSERRNYEKFVNVLSNRFGTTMFRAQLQSKTRQKDENIPQLINSSGISLCIFKFTGCVDIGSFHWCFDRFRYEI
jgi:hypothetical protein